jgi:phenylalanyl-tRNA synthetase beta chain
MKISIEWLREYLDLPEGLEQLRSSLTMAGHVVESITEVAGTTVLELEITSNRPDCLSYLGVAREIAALYGTKIRLGRTAKSMRARKERVAYSIDIRDRDLCPRYVGLVLDGIRVGPSPEWMQRRLEACGMRPVNNIVDITNYVLLERGHPLHAFDFDKLHEGKIIVSRARSGQKMVTLDGVERDLDNEMLLINDGAGPVAIAGVMGGRDSEISDATTRALLECAYFQPASIRRTSKKLGLSTEASYRFERGADWDGPLAAVARTCYWMQELARGRVAGSVQDVYPAVIAPVQISLSRDHAEALLGVSLSPEFIESTLKHLHFRPVRQGKGKWLVRCPSYRADMELEADLIEEIARFFGYQNIPATIPACKSSGQFSAVHATEQAARNIMRGLGFSEIMSLSFAGEQDHRRFPLPDGQPLEIRNPLTEETQFLRASLTPGLVKTVKHNFNHNQRQVRIFEIAKTFRRGADGAVSERNTLAMIGTGLSTGRNWRNPGAEYDFYHLKGAVMALLAGLRCAPPEVVPARAPGWLNDASSAALMVDGKCLGVLGSLHTALEEEFKLKQTVFIAEIDLQGLYPYLFSPTQFKPLARFPTVERDLSIVISREVSYGALRLAILSLGMGELAALELMDVYEGDQIPAGKVGMTLRMIFLDRGGTLVVDRVQSFSDNIVNLLQSSFGAELR